MMGNFSDFDLQTDGQTEEWTNRAKFIGYLRYTGVQKTEIIRSTYIKQRKL